MYPRDEYAKLRIATPQDKTHVTREQFARLWEEATPIARHTVMFMRALRDLRLPLETTKFNHTQSRSIMLN
jgi:hypothetical protein